MEIAEWLSEAVRRNGDWAQRFGSFEPDDSLRVDETLLEQALVELADRLEDNYPFFHPRYIGQMLKPPHPVAVTGYLAAMLVNPNNHALDGGPATAAMEVEAVEALADMFGLRRHLGHLTSSGTIANLEALFVARQSHPGKAIAFSDQAHYTHGRMCHLLGVEGTPLPSDSLGRIDLEAASALAQRGGIGTLVLTAGTTGLGAVDRIDEAMALKDRYGLRIHVDAAYGGFHSILAHDEALARELRIDPAPWRAIAGCDSVVVDPHKHGLQPYGCGAVIFMDPAVARHYAHDSPYTYYTSSGVQHLGEISLECSRAGAAAAALWLTLRLFPLSADGLGRVLAKGRRGALSWAEMLAGSDTLALYQQPELDILTFFPVGGGETLSMSSIDSASARLFESAMSPAERAIYLSLYRVRADELGRRHRGVVQDADESRIIRSVLMKPESATMVGTLHERLQDLARGATDDRGGSP